VSRLCQDSGTGVHQKAIGGYPQEKPRTELLPIGIPKSKNGSVLPRIRPRQQPSAEGREGALPRTRYGRGRGGRLFSASFGFHRLEQRPDPYVRQADRDQTQGGLVREPGFRIYLFQTYQNGPALDRGTPGAEGPGGKGERGTL